MTESNTVRVVFQPSGRRGDVPRGITLVEASRLLGADIEALCGENRVCGKCRVRIEDGTVPGMNVTSRRDHVTPWQEDEARFITPEEQAQGFRLGCAARLLGDVVVFVPEASRAGKSVVSKAARDIPIERDPAVRLFTVTAARPSLEDPTGLLERVTAALKTDHGLTGLRIDTAALQELPSAAREGDGTVTASVWMEREIIRFLPGPGRDAFGLAVDIGTTTCAAYLCNLRTTEVVNTAFMMNPQCRYGEDVMSRITFHMQHPDGLERMRGDLVEGLNRLVETACSGCGTDTPPDTDDDDPDGRPTPMDVLDVTVGGNTAMHHIFLGLDPRSLGTAPFAPVVQQTLDLRARDLGLRIHPEARVFVMPNKAAFIGADSVCATLASGLHRSDETALLIDIGTNGELVLGNRDRLLTASCATGPAFEGGQITCGMRASAGAIERIRIDPETRDVDYKVVGREAWRGFSEPEEMGARGICGSGILDLPAELLLAGVIDASGRFSKDLDSDRLRANPDQGGRKEFVIAWAEETAVGRDIVITQKDIRQIQLAKGALYAGCRILMRHLGLDHVDRVMIAGAFGTHVDREKALIMGLIPDCDPERVVPIGNAAGDGARMVLLDRKKRDEARRLARKVEYVELTAEADFQDAFVAALAIPHQTDAFPHVERLLETRAQERGAAEGPSS